MGTCWSHAVYPESEEDIHCISEILTGRIEEDEAVNYKRTFHLFPALPLELRLKI